MNIESSIDIKAPAPKVWEVMMNFNSYGEWNPFIKSISGEKIAGKKLKVVMQTPGSENTMTLKPKILVLDEPKEFRWKGNLVIPGLFDGEHYFKLIDKENEITSFVHGENFSGILIPLFKGIIEKTKSSFILMNEALKKDVKKNKLLLILIFVSIAALSNAQSAKFDLTTTGTNATIDSAINYALDIWSQYLFPAEPIKIRVNYQSLTSLGPLGIAFPNGEINYPGAPVDDVWYASCLANTLSGQELNPGEQDMEIFINSFFNMYFGTDGNPGIGQYDFVSLLLHEVGHGLGFVSLSNVDGGVGSFGEITAADFAPLGPSFPFPDLQGKPSAYDILLLNTSGDSLSDTSMFQNPGAQLASQLTSNDLVLGGSLPFIANNNNFPKIYAPSSFVLGTSVSHLDETSFPSATAIA